MSNGKFEARNQSTAFSIRILAIGLAAVMLVAGGVALGLNWNRWFGSEAPVEASAFRPELDPNAKVWSGETLPDKSEKKEAVGIRIPGYPSITLPANQTAVTMALLNPEGNPCYFTFELVLKDTEEVLYTSGLVPPGQMISDLTLSRALPAGEYPATIRISTTSLEDGSAMNGANVETLLMVR